MKFTALRLSGFKSFVDPTELALLPGLTGVVGPNGCGKSNLLEALRWVMGESRAKSMRGDGMEDVIFAGADTRPPRNFAEVSLMLEDTADGAPAPFETHETLEIARRITRNAGSIFRINGKEMRARDVRVLFADAATGPQSPSLVRQGQIGLLIAARPQGRRKILEDAAGIAGLYERRREVEQRLRAAEENLVRVDDILVRLDAQVSGLRRQARQAERYTVLTETIKAAGAELLWLRYRTARDEAAQATAAMDAAQRAVDVATTEETRALREQEEAQGALPVLREEATVAEAVYQRMLARREAFDAEMARATQTLARLERETVQLTDDLARESELSGDARTAIEALEDERVGMSGIVADAGAIDAAARAILDAEATLTRAEAERDALAAAAAIGTAERKAAERILAETARVLTDARRRLASVEERTDAEEREVAAVAETLAEARETARMAAGAIAGGPERLAEAEAERRTAQEADTETRATIATRQRALAALDDETSRLQKALAVPAGADAGGVVLGVRAAPGYERALAAALGDAALAPVAAYASDAHGWCDLGVLGTAPEGEPLARYVTAPAALSRVLVTTAVVAREDGTAAQSRLGPGQRLVSRQGDLWRWDGYFRGGDANGEDAAALRLQRLNRRDDLARETKGARQELARAEADRQETVARLEAAQEVETDLRGSLKRAEDAAAASARRLDDLEADHARRTTGLARLHEERDTLTGAADAAATHAAEAQTDADAIADPADLLEKAGDARAALSSARTAREAARTQHAGLVAIETRRVERLEAIGAQMEGWRKRAGVAEERRNDVAGRLQDARESLSAARDVPPKLKDEHRVLDEDCEAATARRTASVVALARADAALRATTAAATEAAKGLSTAREALARTEARAEGAIERARETEADLLDETGDGPETATERFRGLADVAPDAVEARLLRARADRERLGAVNLRAKLEIDEATTERDTLGAEKDDLETAIAKLRTGLAALNREGRERLAAAFVQVNDHFRDLFTHLFGGGQAELKLTESDDPLEAGLEILCQPPGKRVQTLSLLSGGEQTLAAMALIFAVFLVNPAPVCVLDEVDAPLDDANVERFCTLLDEMTRRSDARFLVITHHALTMSRMDRLYGVTMVERGVSKLVSVDLRAAVGLVDP